MLSPATGRARRGLTPSQRQNVCEPYEGPGGTRGYGAHEPDGTSGPWNRAVTCLSQLSYEQRSDERPQAR